MLRQPAYLTADRATFGADAHHCNLLYSRHILASDARHMFARLPLILVETIYFRCSRSFVSVFALYARRSLAHQPYSDSR